MRAWMPAAALTTIAWLIMAACGGPTVMEGPAAHDDRSPGDAARLAWSAWREERHRELSAEDGWLALIGLHWLEEGESSLGSDPAATIVLPADRAPARIGTLVRAGRAVDLVPEPPGSVSLDGAPVTERIRLEADEEGAPTVVEAGSLRMHLIVRGDRIGWRVRDRESAARSAFRGLEVYDYDPRHRVRARLEPAEPGEMLGIVNVLGMQVDEPLVGRLRFELDGQPLALAVIAAGDALFVMLRDATSDAAETYPGGRYLEVAPPDRSGETWIDFNFAYTPPCAFTDLATCPLPPFENALPIAVRAGERHVPSH